jgi:hypothetical protein
MTPGELAEKMSLPLDQLHDNLLYLERVRILSLDRDPSRRYPHELSRVTLTDEGRIMSEELRGRPDLGDDLFDNALMARRFGCLPHQGAACVRS